MASIYEVIFYSLAGGMFSLIGGFLLLSNKQRAIRLADYATPFAAGALLAAAFTDLLPEGSRIGNADTALLFAMVGIFLFFLLERFLHWFHHHHEHEDTESTDPTVSLIIIGDLMHNFIDGVAIAAGFLVSPSTGVVVTLAVAAHEIPQEIGDFGLLMKKGMSRKKIILVNVSSALITTLAAVVFFKIGQAESLPLDVILGLTAGFFIYVAASDIIPSIHKIEDKRLAGWHSILLLIGALVVGLSTNYLHQYIDSSHDHDHDHEHDHSHIINEG